jgi:hypothetical protein
MVEGHVYGYTNPMPKAGTGRILVYPWADGEDHMLSAHWEGEHDGEGPIQHPMRATSADGYAPAVLMWAYWMPSETTVICLTDDDVWLDVDEDLHDQLMKDL